MADEAVSSDDHFLQHLERLEQSKRDAEAETNRLLEIQGRLGLKLKETIDARNRAGKLAMTILAEEGQTAAKKFEYALRRHSLTDRFNAILGEEVRLREELNNTLDDSRITKIREELITTKARLLEGAKMFEVDNLANDVNDSDYPTQFDVDRANRALESSKQVLEEMNRRLSTATSNEAKLREKHRLDQEKNIL